LSLLLIPGFAISSASKRSECGNCGPETVNSPQNTASNKVQGIKQLLHKPFNQSGRNYEFENPYRGCSSGQSSGVTSSFSSFFLKCSNLSAVLYQNLALKIVLSWPVRGAIN
jgi:hypothetical protein